MVPDVQQHRQGYLRRVEVQVAQAVLHADVIVGVAADDRAADFGHDALLFLGGPGGGLLLSRGDEARMGQGLAVVVLAFRQRLPGAVVGECPYRAIAFCLFSVPKRFTKI